MHTHAGTHTHTEALKTVALSQHWSSLCYRKAAVCLSSHCGTLSSRLYFHPVLPSPHVNTLYCSARIVHLGKRPSFICLCRRISENIKRTNWELCKDCLLMCSSLLLCVMLCRQTEQTDKEAPVCGCVSALGLGTELPSISDALFALTIVLARMSHPLCSASSIFHYCTLTSNRAWI